VDEQAMQTFRHQWQVYSKLVDNDYLAHQAVRKVLHRVLLEQVNRPFRFLDLACGDAILAVAALQGTPVIHYHGIDLSAPALELARKTAAALACPVVLELGITCARCASGRSRRKWSGSGFPCTTCKRRTSKS
jgi:hypothetical protein